MSDSSSSTSWWQSLPGVLAASTGVITALTGFYATVFGTSPDAATGEQQAAEVAAEAPFDAELPPTAAGRVEGADEDMCKLPLEERPASCSKAD